MKRTARWTSWIALAVLLQLPATACAWTLDREALWKIVNGMCVPNKQEHSDPAPCDDVDISEGIDRGFAILKDGSPTKPNGYLLIPTRRIETVDDKFMLDADAPNYFRFAWGYRKYVSKRLSLPLTWDMIGLALNSSKDRSQNQFHIHIDCVRAEVRDFLRRGEETFNERWSRTNVPSADHPYFITKIPQDSLEGKNPLKLVAEGLPGASEHIDLETLVLLGAEFQNGKRGFYLLSSHYDGLGSAHGEDLLDPACQVAKSLN